MPQRLWPPPPAGATIHGVVGIIVYQHPETGKPVLGLELPDHETVYLTANIAEMVGGAAEGARKRFEDFERADFAQRN